MEKMVDREDCIDIADEEDDDDAALIEQIKRDSLKLLEESEKQRPDIHDASTTEIFYQGDDAKGFFMSAGETYIYPTNYPIRDYQRNIVHSCLFANTLVSLPTGLGKTFIAAVVMFNFYRWYPRGKIVFMAPTRPLVSQQMRACYDIMGIPVEDTVELLGTTNVNVRRKEWDEKRVFYVTPQTIDNDLKSGVFNPQCLKCLVIDEAHRATKKYAYCQVVQKLREANVTFRVVALSATPGREIQDVINLIGKLGISKLELRSENSLDIVPYTHSKKIDSVEVPLSDLVLSVREEFLKIVDKYTKSLKQNKVLVGNTGTLTKFAVMQAKERYVRSKAQYPHFNRDLDKMILRDFYVTLSLASALENLTTYGLRSFYNNLIEVSKQDGSCPYLGKDDNVQELLQVLKPKLDINILSNDYAWSHLKFIRLREILESHFRSHAERGETTKVMIFANYRVVVAEIADVLKPLEPMVKASMFMGQSSGVTQQEQKEIMKKFRDGEFNTLIATSVAEEGLDIGEIDLVICFDSQKSPIKLVQRLGRTGRKRNGRCVMLVTQGKEAHNFQTSMQTCRSYVEKIINNKAIYASLAQNGPRMIPAHVTPEMRCLHIKVKQRVTPLKGKKAAGPVEKGKKGQKKLNEGARATKPGAKRQKVQAMSESDIGACFLNAAKRKKKKIFVDFMSQESDVVNKDNDVIVVKDELREFEDIYAKLEGWAERCAEGDEFILDNEFFELMDNFLIEDADQTPVDVMDVDQFLETEENLVEDFDENGRRSPSNTAVKESVRDAVSPDLFENFHMDILNDYSPFKTPLASQKSEKCSSPNLALESHLRRDFQSHTEQGDINCGFENLDDGNDDMFLNINSLVPRNISCNNHRLENQAPKSSAGIELEKLLTQEEQEEKEDANDTIKQYGDTFLKERKELSPLITDEYDSVFLENVEPHHPDTSLYQNVDELFKEPLPIVADTNFKVLEASIAPKLDNSLHQSVDELFTEPLPKVAETNSKVLEVANVPKMDTSVYQSVDELFTEPLPKVAETNSNVLEVATAPKLDTSIYQSVDELFDDEEESQSPRPVNNVDIRSYFVSETELQAVSYMEPMSVSDLFEDSSDEIEVDGNDADKVDRRNEAADEQPRNASHRKQTTLDELFEQGGINGRSMRTTESPNRAYSQQESRAFTEVNEKPNMKETTPGRKGAGDQPLPCSSTPNTFNKDQKKSPNKGNQRPTPASPDFSDVFFKQRKATQSKEASPLTRKQKLSRFFQSPDMSEIKSQVAKPPHTSGVKMNLESKFGKISKSLSNSTSNPNKPFGLTQRQDRPISPSCQIVFDSDDEDVEMKVTGIVSTLDGSGMFTVTQLVEMACEREMKQTKLASHLKQQDRSQLSEFLNNKENTRFEKVSQKKDNIRVTPIKLDGLDIVDSSDDDFHVESSQNKSFFKETAFVDKSLMDTARLDNFLTDTSMDRSLVDKSLVDNYVSTRHLARPKLCLPQTKSVLSKLSYVEEKRELKKQSVRPKAGESGLKVNRGGKNQNVVGKLDESGEKPSLQESSDDEFAFFLPKRNVKKPSTALQKSPLLLPKTKTKLKVETPKKVRVKSAAIDCTTPKKLPVVSATSDRKTPKASSVRATFTSDSKTINFNDSDEDWEFLKALAESRQEMGCSSHRNAFADTKEPSRSKPLSTARSTSKSKVRLPDQQSLSKPFEPSTSKVTPRAKSSNPSNRTPLTAPSQSVPPSDNELGEKFGALSEAQFEEWLRKMAGEPREEPVRSQYFAPKPSGPTLGSKGSNAHRILMENRANFDRPSQRRQGIVAPTPRTKSSSNGNRGKVTKDQSLHASVVSISSEDDDDYAFFTKPWNSKATLKGHKDGNASRLLEPNNSNSKQMNKDLLEPNNGNSKRINKDLLRKHPNRKGSNSKGPSADTAKKKASKKPVNPFIEVEADVSLMEGELVSSDDDLTNSSEDEMDSSFIDDDQDKDHTMAHYLKSVRSPTNGAYKIPVLSDEVLSMDVYSQAVAPDRTAYLHDSFCVEDEDNDHWEDQDENEMSLLELAERRLERQRKMKRTKEKEIPRRRRVKMMSSSDED